MLACALQLFWCWSPFHWNLGNKVPVFIRSLTSLYWFCSHHFSNWAYIPSPTIWIVWCTIPHDWFWATCAAFTRGSHSIPYLTWYRGVWPYRNLHLERCQCSLANHGLKSFSNESWIAYPKTDIIVVSTIWLSRHLCLLFRWYAPTSSNWAICDWYWNSKTY